MNLVIKVFGNVLFNKFNGLVKMNEIMLGIFCIGDVLIVNCSNYIKNKMMKLGIKVVNELLIVGGMLLGILIV